VDRVPQRVTNATLRVARSSGNPYKINEVADGFGLALPVASDSVNKEIEMQQARRTILHIALAIGLTAYFLQESNAATLSQGPIQPSIGKTTGKPRNTESIIYKNKKYRFGFALPETWKGYSIIVGEWGGTVFDEGGAGPVGSEKGPQITIRHPKWTNDDPWQDIPIMVFTHAQWKFVEQDGIAVSAASFGPGEIGRNAHYIFALPARFDYGDAKGGEEVQEILQHNAIRAF
jgi:hypothetical protein